MVKTTKCTVCQHPELNAINSQLVSGVAVRPLAKKYDLGLMALQRHRTNHLPRHLVKAQALQEVEAADQLLEQVQSLYDKALDIMNKAEKDKKYAPAVAALKEARSSLELIAKMIGELKVGTHINIIYNAEWIDLRTQIYNALEEHPEARLKIAQALQEVEHEEAIDVGPDPSP